MINLELLKYNLSNAKTWLITTGLFEAFIFTHTPSVFPSYEYILREQNYFPNQTDDELSKTYSKIFTATSMTSSASLFLVGYITDVWGFWYARFYLHVISSIGLVSLTIMSLYKIEYLAFLGVPFWIGNSNAFTRLYRVVLD